MSSTKQSGIWATQTHHESKLNQALETAEHVDLMFSTNKSGEYLERARMLSSIHAEDLALKLPLRCETLAVAGMDSM